MKPTPPTAPRPAVTTSTRRSFTSAEETQAAPAVDLSEYKVVHILGGPGAGKGTQGEKIVAKYGCHHFSAGDLLRAEVASGSEQGNEIDALMKEGELVPQSVTISLLRKAIETSENPELGFLLDGFPRAIDQAETFEAEVTKGKLMLWLDCSEDTMTERLLKRGETSGRADDNAEAIKKRFHTYHEKTGPVLDFFKADDRARVVDSNRDPEAVFADVVAALDGVFAPREDNGPVASTEDSAPESPADNKLTESAANGNLLVEPEPAANAAQSLEVKEATVDAAPTDGLEEKASADAVEKAEAAPSADGAPAAAANAEEALTETATESAAAAVGIGSHPEGGDDAVAKDEDAAGGEEPAAPDGAAPAAEEEQKDTATAAAAPAAKEDEEQAAAVEEAVAPAADDAAAAPPPATDEEQNDNATAAAAPATGEEEQKDTATTAAAEEEGVTADAAPSVE